MSLSPQAKPGVDGDEQQAMAEIKKWAKAYDMSENDVLGEDWCLVISSVVIY